MNEINQLVSSLNNFQTRSSARKSLVALGPDKAGKCLLDKVNSGELVDNAIWALMEIFTEWKYEKAVPAMIGLLSTRPKLVSDIARSLAKITGVDLGADPAAWSSFLDGPTAFSSLRATFEDAELLSFTIQDGYCKIFLPTPNNRKHEVLVYEKDEKLTIYTECGFIMKDQVAAVEELGAKVEYAKLECEEVDGRFKVTLTAEWGGDSIDFKVLKDQIVYFASFADDLENQLTGEDNI